MGGRWWSAGEHRSPHPVQSVRTHLKYDLQVRAQNCSRVGLDFFVCGHIIICFSWTSQNISLLRDSPGVRKTLFAVACLFFGLNVVKRGQGVLGELTLFLRSVTKTEEPKPGTFVSIREMRREMSCDG